MGMLNNIKLSPIKGKNSLGFSSDFGWRTIQGKKSFHSGIDFPGGEIIVSVAPGKVVAMRNNIKGYSETYSSGNYVTVDHGNGIKTVYCHMAYGSVKVKVGDSIKCEQEIGTKGNTGHSTGAHLHFGINVNGTYVDPKPYLLGTKKIESSSTYQGTYPTLPSRGYFYYDAKNKKVVDKGTQVENLQKLLNWLVSDKLTTPLKIDGKLGPACDNAILIYQKTYGLKEDRCFGPTCLKKAKTIKK